MINKNFTLPGWAVTLGGTAITLFGVLVGVATAAWQARALISDQTTAIASLRQTIDETVRPTLAEVATHEKRITGHDAQIAVIEHTCCGETTAAPTRATTMAVTP